MDIGSYSIKVGYAGEDSPRSEINTIIGIHDSISATESKEGGQGQGPAIKERKYYIDPTELMVPRGGQEAKSFFNQGVSKCIEFSTIFYSLNLTEFNQSRTLTCWTR